MKQETLPKPALRLAVRIAAVLSLTFAYIALYMVVDVLATLKGFWTGNAISVAVAAWLEQTAERAGTVLITVIGTFMLYVFNVIVTTLSAFGLSIRTAEIITVMTGLLLYLVFTGFVAWKLRRFIRIPWFSR